MRKWVAALATLTVTAAGATAPATSAQADPEIEGEVICGPALYFDDGQKQACGQATDGGQARNGYYLLDEDRYEWGPWTPLVAACGLDRIGPGFDGEFGRILGYPKVANKSETPRETGITHGVQVRSSGSIRVGRFGYWDYSEQLFHPTTDWLKVDGSQTGLQPDPGADEC